MSHWISEKESKSSCPQAVANHVRTVLLLLFAAAILVSGSSAHADLLSYWDFEGDFVDSVGSNDAALIPDGAQTNNATTGVVAGRSGQVLVLDGLGDGLMTPSDTTLDFGVGDSFTYSYWVKAQENGQTGNNNFRSTFLMRDAQVNPYNGYTMIIGTPNTSFGSFFEANLDGGGATDSASSTADTTASGGMLDDTWRHIAWVVSDIGSATGTSTVYLDGAVYASKTDLSGLASGGGGNTTSSGAQPLFIGAERATGNKWLWGSMDDLAVWNNALPVSSIEGLAGGAYTPTTAPIPEPASGLLLLLGAIVPLAFRGRR